jgi:hypothetical protein
MCASGAYCGARSVSEDMSSLTLRAPHRNRFVLHWTRQIARRDFI